MNYLNEYKGNQYIIKNKEIILEFNGNKIILNKENNYLNLINNFFSNININNDKYTSNSNSSIYYDYFILNNKKEEINENNLTNYIINCILYYVYNFEKDKINKLNYIIINNFMIKRVYNNGYILNNKKYLSYIKINFKKQLFNDIFNLNLNLKINFSNLYFKKNINNISIYNSILIFKNDNRKIYYKKLNNNLFYICKFYNNCINFIKQNYIIDCNYNNCYNYYNNKLNELNKYDKYDKIKYNDELRYNDECKNYLKIKNELVVRLLKNKLKIVEEKYNIIVDKDKYAYSLRCRKNIIKDNNNEIMKDENNNFIIIGLRYVLYFKVNKNIEELNINENNFLGIIYEQSFKNIDFNYNINCYIVKKENHKTWEILNLIDNHNIIYNHNKTIFRIINLYNNYLNNL